MANLSGNINLVSSGVQYAVFIIGTGFTFLFIDKIGRRPLLIYGAIGMGVCMFIVGGVLGTYGNFLPNGLLLGDSYNKSVKVQVTGSPAFTVIAFCYILVLVYALTLAPVAWVYAAEVWSLETRATGMALASIANWLFNFAIGKSHKYNLSISTFANNSTGLFIPPAFENISWKLFIIFGTLCFGAAIQAFFTYPETCGKTLEEIEMLFGPGSLKPWKTKPGDSLLDSKVEYVKTHGKTPGGLFEAAAEHVDAGEAAETNKKTTLEA